MNNLHSVKVNIFRVAPQHCQDKVVHRRDRLVYVLEVHVQEVLAHININHSRIKLIKLGFN